ncbi:ABC transporter substrate-binding protein [Amorphus sp. 3PC139-8]|uniref:ABC transporter substrate-binding protein n=1 Tax=Amorphus sp. 3PC139-8 TaxID=2735676 RepID=UPI00345CA092
MLKYAVAAIAVALPATLAGSSVSAQEVPVCEVDRPVALAGLDWDSSAFHNGVVSFILKHGYGCDTSIVAGSTIPLLNSMARGEVDISMETWIPDIPDAWARVAENGKVEAIGVNYPDATQNWYVPKYTVDGDDAPAKGLASVSDLPNVKDVFADPDKPGMGRFYNCILGWGCEVINTKKLYAYGLTDSYTNFRPGTGAALAATIETHIRRKEPILFYYWGPSRLLGQIGDQIVALEEPPYNEETWAALTSQTNPSDVKEATAYPLTAVSIAVNTAFAEMAPDIIRFLDRYETSNALISDALAYMQAKNATAEEAAVHFLKENPDIWTGWVPDEVTESVKAALTAS